MLPVEPAAEAEAALPPSETVLWEQEAALSEAQFTTAEAEAEELLTAAVLAGGALAAAEVFEPEAPEEAPAETPAAETAAPGEAELPPELPAWLAEEAEPETEPFDGWKPPLVDLNQASMIELERLPGVGFILAQQIITYRDEHGPFQDTDALLNVPGMEPATLEIIRSQLQVSLPPVQAIAPEEERASVGLIAARNAMVQGSLPLALEHYDELIQARQLLPEIIIDLHEAAHRFPADYAIWQSLGDAYVRTDQLQEALDAYSRAEELLS
jgi:competence ComEA-like helix-hairpin-helix protein